MNKSFFIACLLSSLFLAGCSRENTPPPLPTSTQAQPTSSPTPTRIPIQTTAPTSTATHTPSPTVSSTPQPTLTPTVTFTPTPAVISPANARRLQREAAYTLPVRGRLHDARWSQDGKSVLVMTDRGTYLLEGRTLALVEYFPDMSLISEMDGNRWFVWSEGQRKYLELADGGYQLHNVNHLLDELGIDLLSRNGETAVRKTSEEEVEVVSLKTGSRGIFNIQKAGHYPKEIRPVAISPDGKMLIIEDSYWSDLYFVNLETLEVAYKLSNIYSTPIFSPDGQFVLLEDNGGIKVLKAKNGIQYNRFSSGFSIRSDQGGYLYYGRAAYDFLPDSQRVGVVYCVKNERCELYLWSMSTGQPETIIRGLPAGVQAVDLSPDMQSFVVATRDGTLSAWDVASQTELAESFPFDRTAPAVSPDGKLQPSRGAAKSRS